MGKLTFISVFLISISCSPMIKRKLENSVEKSLTTDCEAISELINKNWKKDRKFDFYHTNKDFLDTLQKSYQIYLQGMTRNEVVELLGNPTKSDHSSIVYYLNEECYRMTTETTCNALTFFMDANKIIAFIVQPLPIFIH